MTSRRSRRARLARGRILLACAAAGLVSAAPLHAQTYAMSRHVVAGGGATSTAGPYSLTGTAGQPDASTDLSAAPYAVAGGFWAGAGIPCTVSLSPTSASLGPAASTGNSVIVTAALTDCPWSAVSNDTWITVTSGGSGIGNGTVVYAVGATTVGRMGTLTIGAQTFTVTQAGLPTMTLSATGLNFGAVNNGAGTLTVQTPAQSLLLAQSGPGAVTWTAAANQSWISVSPASGLGSGTLTVSINNTGNVLPATGSVSGTITVTTTGATNSPSTAVQLTIVGPTASTRPFGVFDTPIANASVQGSIAVTGWALDDIAIDRVEIWRDLAPGETTPPFRAPGHPGDGKVFIANALFVAGARSDVEAAYPTYPQASRAGWGYLLLTWGLWDQGNGPFTLYAFAFDREGTSATLGTKAITSGNRTATKPFGALDVPGYGETKSGQFFNFGWALTPNPNVADQRTCLITNGNVFVGIDSGPLTAVDYGDNRTDIAGAFPGFSNASAGGGHFLIDSTTLVNGTHQIGWYVVDNCGRADGIGNRFFTVAKSSLTTAEDGQTDALPTRLEVEAAEGVRVRTTGGEWTLVSPAPTGVYVIAVAQNERLEVQLPTIAGAMYTGAQVVNGESRGLPLGSSLDAARGIFYWQPAAGFLGSFDLVFTSGGAETKVRVVVGPSIRMAIDGPSGSAMVQQPFTVAGWALDLAATSGAGIDTVHVWAYPAADGDPIFLGVADSGDARPDVAATYGEEFERSSFSLPARGLPPGAYDVVVYAHRASTGSFDGAQGVRVIVP